LLFGKFVGKDECGNRYYRTSAAGSFMPGRATGP
jgi:NADH:ubiquinone oxidoreductase subunit